MSKEKWALITGASSGIGKSYVLEFAKRGYNVVLVSRNLSSLNKVKESLGTETKSLVLAIDLSKLDSAKTVFEAVQKSGIEIHTLVNNAGFGSYGPFHLSSYNENQDQMILNMVSLANLTNLFLPGMVERKAGTIINIASTASYQPVPYMAIYSASKAFVRFFTEALWAEYSETGVQFLNVSPGPVETNFFEVVNAKEASVGKRDTPENTVKQSLDALSKRKASIITGPIGNFILSNLSRIVPTQMGLKITKKVMSPKN